LFSKGRRIVITKRRKEIKLFPWKERKRKTRKDKEKRWWRDTYRWRAKTFG
jgi:hypothetical protein